MQVAEPGFEHGQPKFNLQALDTCVNYSSHFPDEEKGSEGGQVTFPWLQITEATRASLSRKEFIEGYSGTRSLSQRVGARACQDPTCGAGLQNDTFAVPGNGRQAHVTESEHRSNVLRVSRCCHDCQNLERWVLPAARFLTQLSSREHT